MNAIAQTAKLIETFFEQRWATLETSVPMGWWNVPFAQPTSGLFGKASIQFGDAIQSSIGSRPLEKMVGFLAVQIFSPKNEGTRQAMLVADNVAGVVRYVQLTGEGVTVDFRAPSISEAIELKDHFQLTVRMPFQSQHITE